MLNDVLRCKADQYVGKVSVTMMNQDVEKDSIYCHGLRFKVLSLDVELSTK